jgi:hypothetical protein
LCNILIEFWVSIKQIRLIKICLNGTYSKVRIGKYLSDTVAIQNGRNKKMLYRHCFTTLL